MKKLAYTGGGIEPPEGTSPGHIPKPGGGTWRTNRHEEAPRHKKCSFGKCSFGGITQSRAPARTDDPRRVRPRREINPLTRLDHQTHRGGRRTHPRRHLPRIAGRTAGSSSLAQLKSEPAPAATAAVAAAGRLGHHTGMPAARGAAKAASAAASGRQRSFKCGRAVQN